MATQFRKKMRAKDSATTALVPAAPSATGACSRDEPQPKFFPATMTVYGVVMPSGGTNGGWSGVRASPASA